MCQCCQLNGHFNFALKPASLQNYCCATTLQQQQRQQKQYRVCCCNVALQQTHSAASTTASGNWFFLCTHTLLVLSNCTTPATPGFVASCRWISLSFLNLFFFLVITKNFSPICSPLDTHLELLPAACFLDASKLFSSQRQKPIDWG